MAAMSYRLCNLSQATHGQPVIHSCFGVGIENRAVILPRSEALVAGKIVGQYAPLVGWPSPTARLMEVNHMILTRILVDTSSDVFPPRVLNPTDYPCALCK